MKARLSILSVLVGFFFLAGSLFVFFLDHSTSKVGPSLIQELFAGAGLLWLHLALFLLAFAVVHGLAGWFVAWAVEPASRSLARNGRDIRGMIFLLFFAAILWILLQAATSFPHSLLGQSLSSFASEGVGQWLRWAIGAIVLVFVGRGLLLHAARARPPMLFAILLATLSPLALGNPGFNSTLSPQQYPNDPTRPHIILVGIDGWRLDMLTRNGGPQGVMPFTEAWLEGAAVIQTTYTPLARTFPAWWTVLTGQFPGTHGARFNLISDEFFHSEAALPLLLGGLGYHRMFAMDERRFANIREVHGFEEVVGPGLGAADFLIGSLLDVPLTNLLINTKIGKYLFPFNHANRAAYSTYRPRTFDRLLGNAIERAPREPLFLAAHFELSHWPFKWADGPVGQFNPNPLGETYGHYLETLQTVDQQIEALFENLQRLGILENALVVLLSDHGEAFDTEEPAWTHMDTGKTLRTSPGHGTDVLSLRQHQIPLAFRRYGGGEFEPGTRMGTASLADIYPTVAEWMGLTESLRADGQSLLAVLQDPAETIPIKPIPLETGFNPAPFLGSPSDAPTMLAAGVAYYQITRDGRLEIKPSETETLLAEKQRAVVYGDKILALLHPDSAEFLLATKSRTTFTQTAAGHDWSTPEAALAQSFCDAFLVDLHHFQAVAPVCGEPVNALTNTQP